MKKILLTLLFFSNLFSQANRLLMLSPSAHTSSIGNVMLPMMSLKIGLSSTSMVIFQ